jgi:hypothetical protein
MRTFGGGAGTLGESYDDSVWGHSFTATASGRPLSDAAFDYRTGLLQVTWRRRLAIIRSIARSGPPGTRTPEK